MISRCSALSDQPPCDEPGGQVVEQLGCEGGLLRVPKSLGVETSGSPKWCIQTRLTMTRPVSGLSAAVMARARSSRPLPWANGVGCSPARMRRNCRGTRSPGWDGIAADEDARVVRLGRVVQRPSPAARPCRPPSPPSGRARPACRRRRPSRRATCRPRSGSWGSRPGCRGWSTISRICRVALSASAGSPACRPAPSSTPRRRGGSARRRRGARRPWP